MECQMAAFTSLRTKRTPPSAKQALNPARVAAAGLSYLVSHGYVIKLATSSYRIKRLGIATDAVLS
jgi:hypothetical protein